MISEPPRDELALVDDAVDDERLAFGCGTEQEGDEALRGRSSSVESERIAEPGYGDWPAVQFECHAVVDPD
jgi:hypothetical protein